jgi:hypothetical protein
MNPKALKLETTVKWIGGICVVLVAGTVAVAVMTSVVAIAATAVVGLAVVNGMPVIARKFASWKYNALRQDAIANPIPNLITALEKQQVMFNERRIGVVQFSTTTKNFQAKIQAFEAKGSDTRQMKVMYDNMKRVLEIQINDLTERAAELKEADVKLGEAQDAYNMALEMQAAGNSLEAFSGKPALDMALQREAFNAITSKLNEGFARMEINMALDYNALPAAIQGTSVSKLEDLTAKLHTVEAL